MNYLKPFGKFSGRVSENFYEFIENLVSKLKKVHEDLMRAYNKNFLGGIRTA